MKDILKSKKIRIIIALFSLIALLNLIQDTYAKYVSSATATSNITVAEWSFKVNNQDINSNNDISSKITPTFTGNTHVKDGVIAPGSIGYFDIVIDATNVEVAHKQKISLEFDNTTTITDIKFLKYTLNNGTEISLSGDNPVIEQNESLTSTNKINTYRIYVQWFDGTGETMNNRLDTEASIDGIAKVKVNLNFVQIAN